MSVPDAALQSLIDQIQTARSEATPLCIRGGGSKDFYGEAPAGAVLDTRSLAGISSYEPTELVVTARCGTRLADLEAALADKGQCLAFEPPHFGADDDGPSATTVGGMVAAGLAGPSRAAVGGVRDYLLGATVVNGQGEVLSFGGQVIKNVAGYDVSRLMAGSMGSLGLIAEVSLKVMPMAPATATLHFDREEAAMLRQINEWGGLPLPINASAWWDGALLLRLRGALAAVQAALAALKRLGGQAIDPAQASAFWAGLRDQTDDFFVRAGHAIAADPSHALWRLSLPQTAPPLNLAGDLLIEWGGGQRWLSSRSPAAQVRAAAAQAGGHATLFRSRDKSAGVFTPLDAALDPIHRELKKSFDPAGLFNPGRLYPGL